MPTGFQSIGDAGIYQIDADYRNMLLIKSGQFTADNAATVRDAWFNDNVTTWQNTTQYAMMAVRAVSPNMLTLTAGAWRSGMKVPSFFYPQAGQSHTFQYYIYDLVGPNPAHTYGMQVFNPSGQLVYSALDHPLKIIAYTNVQAGGNPFYTGPHSELAWMCTGGGYYIDEDGFDAESTFIRTYWIGNSLYANSITYTNPSEQVSQLGLNNQYGVVVDVTNVPKNYSRY